MNLQRMCSPFGVGWSRREILRTLCGQVGFWSCGNWLSEQVQGAEASSGSKRSCILLWMSGGASQLETFDPKPGHANGGPIQGIDTAVSGIRIGEFLPRISRSMQDLAVIRSMSTKEGDHSRAIQHLHTGHQPGGPLIYPTLGSLVAREKGDLQGDLPAFVSIAPTRAISPQGHTAGFLGAEFAPMVVGSSRLLGGPSPDPEGSEGYDQIDRALSVENMASVEPLGDGVLERRLQLLRRQEERFQQGHPDVSVLSHREAYQKASRLMRSEAAQAFRLDMEKVEVRDRYGRTQFGQSCLLARRLVERGVPFVEVSMNGVSGNSALGWDTHQNNFETVKSLCGTLDAGWDSLLTDLRERGMLESTLVVWMGEFGRTPKINGMQGRDHFPDAWSTVLAGGAIRGGQVIGGTSEDGMSVKNRPVSVTDFLSTICLGLGIDYSRQNISNIGRPISIVEGVVQPIREIIRG